ncbi:MAG TPA: hypothetical protein VFP84_27425 [Kofleriaceae bacterium]|nr:hypothetical protein [Kofleriaceae bacterium]
MKLACVWFALVVGGVGCATGKTPQSVRMYAADLPSRADGQYQALDAPLRKQLVTQDASLQCAIDVEDKKAEADSPACKCFKSASADWVSDCKAWLGAHAPTTGAAN